MRYENAEGPTKADYGEGDVGVLERESDESKEGHGWSNPLSWTDDGTDDDLVVNMEFKSLDAPYKEFQMPDWRYDDNIVDSFKSEADAVKSVAKSRDRWAKEAQERQ